MVGEPASVLSAATCNLIHAAFRCALFWVQNALSPVLTPDMSAVVGIAWIVYGILVTVSSVHGSEIGLVLNWFCC